MNNDLLIITLVLFVPAAYSTIINIGIYLYIPFLFKLGKAKHIHYNKQLDILKLIENVKKNNYCFSNRLVRQGILYIRESYSWKNSIFKFRTVVTVTDNSIECVLRYDNLIKFYIFILFSIVVVGCYFTEFPSDLYSLRFKVLFVLWALIFFVTSIAYEKKLIKDHIVIINKIVNDPEDSNDE